MLCRSGREKGGGQRRCYNSAGMYARIRALFACHARVRQLSDANLLMTCGCWVLLLRPSHDEERSSSSTAGAASSSRMLDRKNPQTLASLQCRDGARIVFTSQADRGGLGGGGSGLSTVQFAAWPRNERASLRRNMPTTIWIGIEQDWSLAGTPAAVQEHQPLFLRSECGGLRS